MFDLKKYRGVTFMTLKNHAKFEEKLTCGLENDIRNLANCHQNTLEWSKLGLWWDPFTQSRKCMIWVLNFDPSTQVSKMCTLIGTFRSKYMTFDLRKYRGVIFRDTEVSCKIWRKNWLLVCKMIWEIWKILTRTSKTLPSKCQSWNFDAILLSKVENAWAEKLQRSYV